MNSGASLRRPGAIASAVALTPLSFAAKRLGDGQLLIVATNGPADKALKAYRKRWQIECLFGDSKTRGQNMEDICALTPADRTGPKR